MPISLQLAWAEPVTVDGLDGADNPPVSVDFDSNVLSRFYDPVWTFPKSAARPRCRMSVRWPDGIDANLVAAKQLALLRLTHGRAIGQTAARLVCSILASLAAFCEERGISVSALHRHPHVVIDFCQQSSSRQRIITIASIARLASVMRQQLGWTFLEAAQVAALDAIEVLDKQQYPVIPQRILGALDEVADSILSGYLANADEFDEVCAIRSQASKHMRSQDNPANWQRLLSQRPRLSAEFNRWAPRTKTPLISYIKAVRIAAFWVIAGGSCARRSEILSLRRGCLTREQVGSNQAYLLSATTTKTQDNPHAIWVVSPRVEPAVQALERMLCGYEHVHPAPPRLTNYLFQVFDPTFGCHRAPSHARKGKLNHGDPIANVDFSVLQNAAETRITREDWEEAKRLTPSLDEVKFAVGVDWIASPHQLRRTVLVHAAASGLVSQDSLSFQAKHQTWQMTSYYCQYYWQLTATDPDNPLVARTQQADANEFTKIYADAYNRDRLQAIEDDRFFSPYGNEHKRLAIETIPLLSLDDIKRGQTHDVLKRNTIGLCAKGDYCEWQVAITVRGCLTKDAGNICASAIIDAERLKELRGLHQDLTCQMESLNAKDTFASEQLDADLAATEQAIALIEQHDYAIPQEY